jgi:hypothetical protein
MGAIGFFTLPTHSLRYNTKKLPFLTRLAYIISLAAPPYFTHSPRKNGIFMEMF